MTTAAIETKRLRLRTWKQEDSEVFFQINQDPRVIEWLAGPLTRKQVSDFIETANRDQKQYGYALWAVELKKTGLCIGFIGFHNMDFPAHFAPAVEIAWRLGSEHWGRGYATEGAKAALEYGRYQCNLKQIVSVTAFANKRSIRVMEKIGLKREVNGDFLHPKLEDTHPLSRHILYRFDCN